MQTTKVSVTYRHKILWKLSLEPDSTFDDFFRNLGMQKSLSLSIHKILVVMYNIASGVLGEIFIIDTHFFTENISSWLLRHNDDLVSKIKLSAYMHTFSHFSFL